MDYPKTLPLTGGGIVIGGIAFGRYWILLASILLVALGAVLIRVLFRRGKEATQV